MTIYEKWYTYTHIIVSYKKSMGKKQEVSYLEPTLALNIISWGNV